MLLNMLMLVCCAVLSTNVHTCRTQDCLVRMQDAVILLCCTGQAYKNACQAHWAGQGDAYSLTGKDSPVVLEEETNVARLPSLALLPHSRLAQPEDTVVQHVQDGNHTNTVSCTPHTAKPANIRTSH